VNPAGSVRTVHVVVPDGVDDAARPSGGNVYDRRVCAGLRAVGWDVHEHPVGSGWPAPTADATRSLGTVVAGLPDGALVLVDGLVASTAPEVLVPQARRLDLVVLVHMPFGDVRERAVLCAARAVVTTSEWTRAELLRAHPLRPTAVHVARPGTDRARLATGTPGGGAVLCVAAVLPQKGHDVLLAALARLADRTWTCRCVGALDRDPGFVARLRRRADRDGIGDRVEFTRPRAGAALARTYAAADVLVLASRAETYGMVLTEALARGVPVIATDVGGVAEAVGSNAEGERPGLLVRPGDPAALAVALARWLDERPLRDHLRRVARERRATLPGWAATTARVAAALTELVPV
jgi:glycosyltransferase involved in cell wall biosynthesis